MKASSSKQSLRRHGGLYCCWLLTITLFMILVNKSVCQPHNFFKGSSVAQLPSKALPRIGRRSGVDFDQLPLDQNDITTMTGIDGEGGGTGGGGDQDMRQPPPGMGMDFYNNAPAPASAVVATDVDPDTEFEIYRNSKLLSPLAPATDRGLIYILKTLARRESEAARRRGKVSTGGFRQDQPTGIHPFR